VALNPRALQLRPGAAWQSWSGREGDPGAGPKPGFTAILVEGLETIDASKIAYSIEAAGGRFRRRSERGRSSLVLEGVPEAIDACLDRLAREAGRLAEIARVLRECVAAAGRDRYEVPLPGGRLELGGRMRIVGVVNVTPDSFSDGGRYLAPESAIAHAVSLARAGADLLDIGGESTRPGSDPVPAEEECRRILPVIEEVARRVAVPISVDTSKASVAERAIEAGARCINDASGLEEDPELARVAARRGVPIILMHRRGRPKTMQDDPRYENLMSEVCRRLREAIRSAIRAGVPEEAILLDPGIGFGKTLEHNVEIFRCAAELRSLGRPLLFGPSRKAFLGALTGRPVGDREFGTAAAVAACAFAGVHAVRVHDVEAMVQAARVAEALRG